MSLITVRCEHCSRESILMPRDITLVWPSLGGAARYAFTCQNRDCKKATGRDVIAPIVAMLQDAGVHIQPAPLEVLEEHHGPVFTDADEKHLHEWLNEPALGL